MADYSGYQYYQDQAWQDASAAGVGAYTERAYQCPWSQRSPAYMFNDFTQKQQFDAANTTCCNEPITPFGNKPQYVESAKPMRSTDCGKKLVSSECSELVVSYQTGAVFAASGAGGAVIPEIRIACPKLCPDLVQLIGDGEWYGSAGRFVSNGLETESEMLVDYYPDSSQAQLIYNTCGGWVDKTETFCEEYQLSFVVGATLNDPAYTCDCCNASGQFVTPTGAVSSGTPSATWGNTWDLGQVTVNTACRGGDITGSVAWNHGGSSVVPWSVSPSYESDGSTRLINGTAGTVGSSSQPACCGANITYRGTDGCGGTKSRSVYVPRKPASPSITPSAGALYAGDTTTVTISGTCNLSASVSATLTPTNVDPALWGAFYYGVSGQITRSLGALALSGTFAAKGCCGAGSISGSYNDGCGNAGSKTWSVKNRASTGSTVVGTVFRCQVAGSYYQVYKADLKCDGTEGTSWTQFSATNHTNVSVCNQSIDGPTDSNITGACNSSTYCPSAPNCCHYINNGLTGTLFRAAIFCVNNSGWNTTPICCTEPYSGSAAWVNTGSATCCPN